MLKVDQVNSIICLVNREGKSYAEAAKILGIDPRTVKKYADLNDHSIQLQRRERSTPVMNPVKDIIDGWLEQDLKVPKKQRHTARRVYDRLRDEHGFTGSERSVRRYVSQKKRELNGNNQQEYLPLIGLPGEAEFDFGEVVVIYKGQEIKAQFFTTGKLVESLLTHRDKGTLVRFMERLEKLDLLVIDEFGYVPFNPEGAKLLFQVVADSYERKSIILTTNLEFQQWHSLLGDGHLAAAMIDRLIHHT